MIMTLMRKLKDSFKIKLSFRSVKKSVHTKNTYLANFKRQVMKDSMILKNILEMKVTMEHLTRIIDMMDMIHMEDTKEMDMDLITVVIQAIEEEEATEGIMEHAIISMAIKVWIHIILFHHFKEKTQKQKILITIQDRNGETKTNQM